MPPQGLAAGPEQGDRSRTLSLVYDILAAPLAGRAPPAAHAKEVEDVGGAAATAAAHALLHRLLTKLQGCMQYREMADCATRTLCIGMA